jgi:L-lactate permease
MNDTTTTLSPSFLPEGGNDNELTELYTYNCVSPDNTICAETCVSLIACQDCDCTITSVQPVDGPWGDVMDVIMCFIPVLVLLVVTVKPNNPWPTTQSLPVAAFLMFLVRTAYLGSDPLQTCSAVLQGILEAWTPLSIMAGAIMLFESMEATLCLPFMMREMQLLTAGHAVAELMLLFAFAYTVEGASGFGTPVALAAPMLVRTGKPALPSVVIMLMFNTLATVWGAVGTPLWFGFGSLPDITDDDLITISQKAAIALGVAGFLVVPWLLTVMVSWKTVRANGMFLYASLIVTVGPSIGIAMGNYEFPSLAGGLVGCLGTAVLIHFKVGLKDIEEEEEIANDIDANTAQEEEPGAMAAAAATTASTKNHSPGETSTDDEKHNSSLATGRFAEAEVSPQGKGEVIVLSTTSQEEQELVDVFDVNENQDEETNENSRNQDKKRSLHHMSSAEVLLDMADKNEEDLLGPRKSWNEGHFKDMILRTFPIWGVVLILILTRIEQIGIKDQLTKTEPYFSIHFGTLGTFRLSSSIVFQMRNILTFPNMNWKYELLYVPFLIPFVLVSCITMILFRKDLQCRPVDIVKTVAGRLKNPAVALLGALVLVQLMIRTGKESPAYILGSNLASWLQEGFVVISPLLGALGSFFSGSTTVSNLTFGEIQSIAAESIGTSKTTMLALQAVGGSAGNGICLNNIIAACAVVGLTVGEGKILVQTYKFVLTITTIATIVMLAFYFRFGDSDE